MLGDNPDKSWEALGRDDPYYGVLSATRFRSANLDASAKEEFWGSGRAHISALIARIEAKLGPVKRGNALDFGCGVGRLVLPLAEQQGFAHVTRVDISPSMLAEAAKNAGEHGLGSVAFVVSDDSLSRLDRRYDFIHSVIVLQHIPADRGQQLVQRLIQALAPGGVAALHMPISSTTSPTRQAFGYMRMKFSPLNMLANAWQRRPWGEPMMQMNVYDLNALFTALCEQGIREFSVELVTEGIHTSMYLLVKR